MQTLSLHKKADYLWTLCAKLAKEQEIREELSKSFDDGSWIQEIPGRGILKEFTNRFVKVRGKGIAYEALRNLIISSMVSASYKPEGMADVLRKIESSKNGDVPIG